MTIVVKMSVSAGKRLRRWGLGKDTIKVFEDLSITDDLLPSLDVNLLKDLILQPLDLVRFKINRQKDFGKNITKSSEQCETFPPHDTLLDDFQGKVLASSDIIVPITISPINFEEISICELERAEEESDSQVAGTSTKKRRLLETVKLQTAESPPRRCAKDTDEIDLEKVLKVSKNTIAAWNSYKLDGKLRDTDRDAIAGAVIDYELTDDLDRRISPGRFVFLSEQILKYFPTEAQSVWAVINSTSVFLTGKGKLYTRWSNTRRKYMELGLIPRPTKGRKGAGKPNANDVKFDDIEIEKFKEDIIIWLKNSAEPWVEIEKRWAETSIERSLLFRESTEIRDYLTAYPAFKNPRGYTLVDIDFESLYPDSSKKLFALWPKLQSFLLQHMPNIHGVSASSIKDSTAQGNFLLMNISHMFRVVNVRKQAKTVKEWRPSKIEMQEAFLLHVKVIGNLDIKLNERRNRVLRFGCQLQPSAAIVGPSFDKIEQCFVIFDEGYRYEVETPLKAIDIAFKAIYTLDAQYPPEAAGIWQFIQRGIYEIPMNKKYNAYCNNVEKLLNEFYTKEVGS